MLASRWLFLLVVLSLFSGCRPKNFTCKDVRNGSFYFDGKISGGKYLIIRQDSIQKELSYDSKDTSYWRVEWFDECNYSLKYINGLNKLEEPQQELVRMQNVYVRILNIKEDFYCIKINGGVLPREGTIDTIWRNKN